MPLCDYFSAPDDAAALAVLDTLGGPGPRGLDTVPLKGVDPVVVIARLEAVLTGCTYREAAARPRAGRALAVPDEDDSSTVVTLTDTLAAALGTLPPADLPRLAEAWSRTEELQEYGTTPAEAAAVLRALAELARRAGESGQRLYCWWAL
ncbi:hypothetical protein [Kitasatospora sp. NPDC057198]|uniref:hypothetical protein n=1 Tax=Kitasatospora sp. NPDC057198 TaxID=3346046 RepID=UPI00363E0470